MRLIVMFIVSLVLLIVDPLAVSAEQLSTESLVQSARSAILIDAATGRVLFQKNSHEKLAPASMTKMMTLLLIMEAIEKKRLHYDDLIDVSEKAASMGGSQIFLQPEEQMSVRDLVKGIAIASANDAAVAMAEHLGGSEERFVTMMNQRAKELGCRHTRFKNTNGLPEQGHMSSAYDMSLIARALLRHSSITQFTRLYEDYLRKGSKKPFWLVNTNKLIKHYPGVDGLKTGFTQQAKYCLTVTAKRGHLRPIAVVMGEPDIKSRNQDVIAMLNHAFAKYNSVVLYRKGDFITHKRLHKSAPSSIPLYAPTDISLLINKRESSQGVTRKIRWQKEQAPIRSGDVVGQLVIQKRGQTVAKYDLQSHRNVDQAGLWDTLKQVSYEMLLQAES